MNNLENISARPVLRDYIYVSKVGEYDVAQRNVFAVAGHRAEALIHTFESSNTSDSEKTRAARRFLAMTGIHPQAIHDEIAKINAKWFTSKKST